MAKYNVKLKDNETTPRSYTVGAYRFVPGRPTKVEEQHVGQFKGHPIFEPPQLIAEPASPKKE